MKDFFDKQSPTLSFEIFPPKGKGELSSIFATVDALEIIVISNSCFRYSSSGMINGFSPSPYGNSVVSKNSFLFLIKSLSCDKVSPFTILT